MSESPARPHGPVVAVLPRADDPAPYLAGFAFSAEAPPAGAAGVFVLTRRVGDTAYPIYVGECDDIPAAIAAYGEADPGGFAEADGCLWTERTQARLRAQMARDLIGKYHPPRNVEHRNGMAAPEIASLMLDRFQPDGATGASVVPAGEIAATEEELAHLVDHFYVAARQDELIGPVFERRVPDWDAHSRTVRDFWSRAILRTQRYNGTPFTPHLSMGLKPEHFVRWIELFKLSAAATLRPEAAAFAVAKVEHMAKCFQTGLFLPPIGTGG